MQLPDPPHSISSMCARRYDRLLCEKDTCTPVSLSVKREEEEVHSTLAKAAPHEVGVHCTSYISISLSCQTV